MTKIYTKTGDDGDTGLVSGKRISKADPRINLYGEVDELNSRIGYSHTLMVEKKLYPNEAAFLNKIQNALFDLGSNLACEAETRAYFKLPQLKDELIEELETGIDTLQSSLPELKNFILPGGALTASSLHVCRTSTRNCERKLVAYHQETLEKLPYDSLIFLNRLSDYFFVLARYCNKMESVAEIPWKPI